MDDLQKASILLKHLAPKEREQILGGFESELREQLEQRIDNASAVSHAELAGIVSEYQIWLRKYSVSTDEKPDQVESVESQANSITDDEYHQHAISCDVESLAGRLVSEPATVLSAVLCQLRESVAREVYELLAPDRKAAVVARLPAQGELRPIVKRELANVLNASADNGERENGPGNALLARLVGP